LLLPAESLTRPPRGIPFVLAGFLIAACSLWFPGAGFAASPVEGAPALSPRNASYNIQATLNPAEKELLGREVIVWRNIQQEATGEFWIHLYWNAWRNNHSTWMREDRLRGRSDRKDDLKPADWSYMEVDSIRLLTAGEEPDQGPGPGEELLGASRFVSPDDGNPEDRTVLVVSLPREVQPGETIRVEITWHARVPRTFARTGYRGEYYFMAQWFPKVGVFEAEGWNCHQFHAATEFFSDYGVYDVKLTLPAGFTVGATGTEQGSPTRVGEMVTHHFRQADVHDFAWVASPTAQVLEADFTSRELPDVAMRLILEPEHAAQAERYFAATRAALHFYGTWYGPYPYDHITIVDPAYGSGAGGMEYPTLFTGGTRLWNPVGGDSPESVTVHEAGHQFWYALVGNNEFEDAWLDEGLNTYSTLRTLDAAYGDRLLVRRYLQPPGSGRRQSGFFPMVFPGVKVDRWLDRVNRYRQSATSDNPSTPTYLYHPGSAGDITYSKTALWLATLERTLGWETMQPIMATYFQRFRFGHPAPDDFMAVAREVSGRDLDWFFDQVYRDDVSFDYAVDSVASFPVTLEGYGEGENGPVLIPEDDAGEEDPDDPSTVYRTEVVVRRLGGGVFPVDLLMVFEDDSTAHDSWDGAARWKLFVEERPAKLAYAVVDPEHKLMLDLNITNNSLLREPSDRLPAIKWSSKWMIWMQDLLWNFAFFS